MIYKISDCHNEYKIVSTTPSSVARQLGDIDLIEKIVVQPLENFSLKKQHAFPMIKSIGYEKEFLDLEPQIVGKYPLNYVMIKDPKTKIFHYLLITALEATKQEALKYLKIGRAHV